MRNTRIANADWSTINLPQLRKLPVYHLPPTYHLQDDSGNGCAGDPPGYPTYFTRSVYTTHGNSPPRGYSLVITGPNTGGCRGVEPSNWSGQTWEEFDAKRKALFRRLWLPLPLDHPRTLAWIASTFVHHRHCYLPPGFKNWNDDMLIWPGGCLGKTPFGTLKDVAYEIQWAREHESFDKWLPLHKEQFQARILAENERITAECQKIATPDKATATILVRRYYPEFTPADDLFSESLQSPGAWWETLSECPTPQCCPGQYGTEHPVNGSWCQFCGWHAPTEVA